MAEKKIPQVRVGNSWVPAHRVWNVVESINTAADLVEKFNENRPELSTPATLEAVGKVRTRIRAMEFAMGGEGALLAAAIEAGVADPEKGGQDQHGETEVAVAEGNHGSVEVTRPSSNHRFLSDEDLAATACQLLAAMSLEEALNMLKADYDNPVDIHALVSIVGKEAYMESLTREAKDLAANMIAVNQIAELWNELHFPSPIGGLWTTHDVEQLLR